MREREREILFGLLDIPDLFTGNGFDRSRRVRFFIHEQFFIVTFNFFYSLFESFESHKNLICYSKTFYLIYIYTQCELYVYAIQNVEYGHGG